MYDFQTKIGVLGGGQLGKMLALAAGNWHLPVYTLDRCQDFPAGPFTQLTEGDFNNYEDVCRFGSTMDVLTIEIEHVNTEALRQLQKDGKKIFPQPDALDIIKDKGLQKQFYKKHDIPTAPFQLFENQKAVKAALDSGDLHYPFVQKSRTAGYDGKGVAVIKNESDLQSKLLSGPCMIENLVAIEKELSVIVTRNESGAMAAFPTVEMEFNPQANLVEFLLCPAQITESQEKVAVGLAKSIIEKLDTCGILAVELFLDTTGQILVNEVAPRPHNSGHHTIDSCYTSQYEQHLRAILNLPPGSTRKKTAAVMVNLLGEPGYTGPTQYEGVEDCLALEGVKVYLYGKSITKPYRKMGHATVLAKDLSEAYRKANIVKQKLKVIA